MSTRVNGSLAVALSLTAASWTASIGLRPCLPEVVPIHWNLAGAVDGYGPKSVALFAIPSVMLAMLPALLWLPYLTPKDLQPVSFRPILYYQTAVVVGLFAYLHGVILIATWQHVARVARPIDVGRAMLAGIFPVLGLAGAVLGKVRRNAFVGVRVPWTLASERVWDDTHRLAARTTVVGAVAGFLAVAAGLSPLLAVAAFIGSVVVPVGYSFVRYKQLERRGAL